MTQLPHVFEHVQHINGVDSVIFNPKTDDLHSDSLKSVPNGHCSLVISPV